jgi:hypothetical protein
MNVASLAISKIHSSATPVAFALQFSRLDTQFTTNAAAWDEFPMVGRQLSDAMAVGSP